MYPQKTYSFDEAQKVLENYCAYQERCHKEVIDKLKSMRMIPEVIDAIVVHLLTNNYLNEERYAKTFTRGKFRIKKWGKNRIVRELRFRQISKYNIDNALKEINNQDYFETLHDLSIKRLNQIKEKDIYKKRKKLADYLLYRGWESNLVYEKINELIN